MLKKTIISLISICVIAGTLLLGFFVLYFVVPSQKAQDEIVLAEQVSDPESEDTEESEDEETDSEESDNIYVADVYQSLTLRSQPSSNADPVTDEGIEPLTQLEVQEFITDTDFAYVRVLEGENKDVFGYVNSEYITKLGEPTIRAVQE